MRNKSICSTLFIGLIVILSVVVFISTDLGTRKAQGADPILMEEYAFEEGSNVVFEIIYLDDDDDDGTVILNLDGDPFEMTSEAYYTPSEGQYFYVYIVGSTIDDYSEFDFYAEDSTGAFTTLDDYGEPFLVGDYLGWGEKPQLTNPTVYHDDSLGAYVFGIDYQDAEGDEGVILLYIFNETDPDAYEMDPTEGNPLEGQHFEVSILDLNIGEDWLFYFEAGDDMGSYAYLFDQGEQYFVVGNLLGSNGGGNGGGNGDGGVVIGAGWFDNPEVVVGIIGLVAIGAGSAYGVYRRKKKHGRFSELLTEMDKIYGSFKTNPKRCELELEKMRATINEDLKKSTIDDNNYSILKGRIDEILGEIRSESIKTEVAELPKDIELKIKDMLIDGEITRAEYDKILPLIKGSDMASDDKEKTKKIVESWMKKE